MKIEKHVSFVSISGGGVVPSPITIYSCCTS